MHGPTGASEKMNLNNILSSWRNQKKRRILKPRVLEDSSGSWDESPLKDSTLRYKRNILLFSFGVMALSVFPDIELDKFLPFGQSIAKKTALTIIGLLLLYNFVVYSVYAWVDWHNWSERLRKDTFTYLRMLCGKWPDDEVIHRHPKWLSGNVELEHFRPVNPEMVSYVLSIKNKRQPDEKESILFSAPRSHVISARWRIGLFAVLDVFFPLVAASIAAFIIFSQIFSAQVAELPITERNQALQYRSLQVWPSETG